MLPCQNRRGFTLIELLIVVAIIAILAAIAVPNFLEAQVRAKVARARNEMRTLATGLEAYAVDNNVYVPCMWNFDPVEPVWGGDSGVTLWRLTTPVAYLTGILSSPFTQHLNPTGAPEDYYFQYVLYPTIAGGVYEYLPWWIEERHPTGGGAHGRQMFLQWGYSSALQWELTGAGPDANRNDTGVAGSDRLLQMPYDPTNGSVSAGDLYRWGP